MHDVFTVKTEIPKIILPIAGRTAEEIFEQLPPVLNASPDVVEWRADYCEDGKDPRKAAEIAKKLADALNGIPLLFTFRSAREGGMQDIAPDDYTALICRLSESRAVSAVDVEALTGEPAARRIVQAAHANNKAAVASCHDFDKTPSDEEMLALFRLMSETGADILKLAVMPRTEEDVERLLKVTRTAGQSLPRLITMSMGEKGKISRITGELTGSFMTFGTAGVSSAPGQIPAALLRSALQNIHRLLRNGNLALIGFMGTGKTTVGKHLAELFGLAFAETDYLIAAEAGMSIPEIFEKYGEAHFRDLESRILKSLSEKTGCVISCGGGAVLRQENVDALRRVSRLILLTASPETILARTMQDSSRPLLRGKKSAEDIKELLSRREEAYQNAADITIDTDGMTIPELCREIILRAAFLDSSAF